VALAALVIAYRRRDMRGLLILGSAMLVAWSGIAGWWFLRNLQLYGELFGTRTMAAVAGERLGGFDITTLLGEFEGFRIAFWGWFGAVNIIVTPIFYLIMDVVTLLAVAGALLYGYRARVQRLHLTLLILIVILAAVAVIAWTTQTYASQGRLLFPYLVAISTLMAIGLSTLLRRLAFVVPVGLAVVALLVPFTALVPSYAAPQRLDNLPTTATPVFARYGDVELVGYEVQARRYSPGENIPITLYWRVLQTSDRDLSLWLHAITDRVIGKVDSYPGGGTLRSSTWQRGLYADTYAIALTSDSPRDALRIQVGWWDYATEALIDPTDESGAPLSSVMLAAGAFGTPESPALPHDVTPVESVVFGAAIALRGYRLAGDQLTLWWEALAPLAQDYTVFAQVLDGENTVLSQGDAPPELPTQFWLTGERFSTQHTIAFQAGADQRVIVGWYNPIDFARLSTDAPDDAYVLVGLR
jgi:hypothetical protein